MMIANTMGMTTAKATGKVTLFESDGFCTLEEPVESRLKSEETVDMGLSINRWIEAGCGRATAFGSLLWR